jgi:hypothetical protein
MARESSAHPFRLFVYSSPRTSTFHCGSEWLESVLRPLCRLSERPRGDITDFKWWQILPEGFHPEAGYPGIKKHPSSRRLEMHSRSGLTSNCMYGMVSRAFQLLELCCSITVIVQPRPASEVKTRSKRNDVWLQVKWQAIHRWFSPLRWRVASQVHRIASKEPSRWKDLCTENFQQLEPWAFRDPHVVSRTGVDPKTAWMCCLY